jgi:uncharacterized protein YfaP (DUF2135 family)
MFNERELRVHGSGVRKREPSKSAIKANPPDLAFGGVQIGESAKLPITLTNTGNSAITVAGEELRGAGFTIAGHRSPLTLEPRHHVTITIVFVPQKAGSVTGELTLTEREHAALLIPLRGTGTSAGNLKEVPAAMNFGKVTVGQSASRAGILSATAGSVNIHSITSSSSEFVVTGLSLPMTIAAGQRVHYTVTFRPQQSGVALATLSFASSASNSRLSLQVHGSGVRGSEPPPKSALKASPPRLTFGSVQVGESAKLRIVLTNTGTSSATISGSDLRGTGFSTVGLSPALTLEPDHSFTFFIEFAPETSGSLSGELSFTQREHAALVIPLRGTGASAGRLNDAPAAMNFGNVPVGKSATGTGTLTATGGIVKVNSVTSSSSEFVVKGISVPLTIAAGQSVHYTVTFSPQQSGTASASLLFASSASDSKLSESLTGSGSAAPKPVVALSWHASTSHVAGYNVYRGKRGGGPYARINGGTDPATTFTDTSVVPGNTYFYVITAVNSRGQESKYSNQAQVVVPNTQ